MCPTRPKAGKVRPPYAEIDCSRMHAAAPLHPSDPTRFPPPVRFCTGHPCLQSVSRKMGRKERASRANYGVVVHLENFVSRAPRLLKCKCKSNPGRVTFPNFLAPVTSSIVWGDAREISPVFNDATYFFILLAFPRRVWIVSFETRPCARDREIFLGFPSGGEVVFFFFFCFFGSERQVQEERTAGQHIAKDFLMLGGASLLLYHQR